MCFKMFKEVFVSGGGGGTESFVWLLSFSAGAGNLKKCDVFWLSCSSDTNINKAAEVRLNYSRWRLPVNLKTSKIMEVAYLRYKRFLHFFFNAT